MELIHRYIRDSKYDQVFSYVSKVHSQKIHMFNSLKLQGKVYYGAVDSKDQTRHQRLEDILEINPRHSVLKSEKGIIFGC